MREQSLVCDTSLLLLRTYGDRVQYSVFECLLDKNPLDKMADRINKILIEKEDSVRIYCPCANCEREIRVIGKGEVSKNEDVYII
ncbi:MAG: CRISPR-associated endonuclease Cas2 [Deltaproteobacteria bacterium]|nr:CRISPR-associated endonuclease Cas2 [Deltaproteobacteria bacterium]